MKTTFDKVAIGQRFSIGVNGRYTKTGATTADKHSGSGLPVNIAFGHELVVTVDSASDKQLNALREAVRASQAARQALADLQVQMPADISLGGFDAMRGHVNVLAHSKDWRDIDASHVAALLDIIKQA